MDDEQRVADEWVRPVYLRLLHGNFWRSLTAGAWSDEQAAVVHDVRRCVDEVEPHIVARLLRQRDWRPRLAAAWYAGLRGWEQFTDELGTLLLASEVCFAGEGYAAALACFASVAAAEHLCRYLDHWLPKVDHPYDQGSAIAALVWIDCRRRTTRAERFIQPGGLWDRWATAQAGGATSTFALARAQNHFDRTLTAALAGLRHR